MKDEKKPKLLEQVREVIHIKHYSLRTEESYINWIKRFIFFHNKKHPIEMGEKEIGQFITHLAKDKKVSASTQNQALCAIIFLYKKCLEKGIGKYNFHLLVKKDRKNYLWFLQKVKLLKF
jgi:site-specific recombinase XerD